MAVSRNTPSVDPVVRAVSACISRHVATGESVVVGFSGGMDSSVLLDAANAVTREATIQLQAIHVHHGLSANADAWAEFCSDRCQSLKIPLDIVRVAVVPLRGEGVEAAARRCRHGILDSHPAQWKMLAHHADDQAETLLHNLLRGTGVRGAAAMPEMRGCLLRPLLSLTRKTLSEYATARKLQWIDDESNLDCRYTRNFLRASVFPSLTDRFPRGWNNWPRLRRDLPKPARCLTISLGSIFAPIHRAFRCRWRYYANCRKYARATSLGQC